MTMKWVRASKYHEESGNYYVSAAKSEGRWKFTLARGWYLLGVFDTADEAKREAERHDIERRD